MDPVAVPLPLPVALVGWILAAALVARATRSAPWASVTQGTAVHLWYGGVFCLVVLWSIRATIGAGFTFHLLGVAAFTLAVGPALALAGGAIAVAIEILVRGEPWINAGLGFLSTVAVPVGTASLVLRFAERRLPPNFFIYIFVVAFVGAGASYAAAGLAGATLLTLGGGQPAGIVFGEYAPYFLFLAFGEATLTGMVITLAVVYRPRWVTTFDDARYLKGR